jgi:hypothetical protein
VFAIYCQTFFICLQIANQLPLLIWDTPALMSWHRKYSPYYMTALQAISLLFALKAFFLLDIKRDWWKLLLAGAIFALTKWGLTRLYARAIVELVIYQMGS